MHYIYIYLIIIYIYLYNICIHKFIIYYDSNIKLKYNNISKFPKNHNKNKDKRDRLKILIINIDFIFYQIDITLLI